MTSTPNMLMPLTMLPPGQVGRIVQIHAGQRLKQRLMGMGLAPGNTVRVLRDNGGPLLLAVGESRIALGRGMAHKILVQAVSDPIPRGEFVS